MTNAERIAKEKEEMEHAGWRIVGMDYGGKDKSYSMLGVFSKDGCEESIRLDTGGYESRLEVGADVKKFCRKWNLELPFWVGL